MAQGKSDYEYGSPTVLPADFAIDGLMACESADEETTAVQRLLMSSA